MTDEAMLKLAREIAAVSHSDDSTMQAIFRDGRGDHGRSVQSAITAIKETTERAAKYIAANHGPMCLDDCLRNGEHLK